MIDDGDLHLKGGIVEACMPCGVPGTKLCARFPATRYFHGWRSEALEQKLYNCFCILYETNKNQPIIVQSDFVEGLLPMIITVDVLKSVNIDKQQKNNHSGTPAFIPKDWF